MAPAADSPEAWAPDGTKGAALQSFETVVSNLAMNPEHLANILEDKDFDATGKADDAVDFEDISDDDLPDDEEPAGAGSPAPASPTSDAAMHANDDDDDLWGDGHMESHFARLEQANGEALENGHASAGAPSPVPDDDLGDLNFEAEPTDQHRNQDATIPETAETMDDLRKQMFPAFQQGVSYSWLDLLPEKKSYWVDKYKATRPPKPLVPTKLSLEIDVDQEKIFRMPAPAKPPGKRQRIAEMEARGLIPLGQESDSDPSEAEDFSLDLEDTANIGPYSLAGIQLLCDDWDAMIDPQQPPVSLQESVTIVDEEMDDWDRQYLHKSSPSAVRKKFQPGLPDITKFHTPDLISFEEVTARNAKRVHIDMNDPYMYVDTIETTERASKRQKLDTTDGSRSSSKPTRSFAQRFNASNDEAYDMLKENHHNRVRATVGNVAIEHSMPAQKLAWPYYKFTVDMNQKFHRPAFLVKGFFISGRTITMTKPIKVGKTQRRGKKVHELFAETKDLTLNDNSQVVLFEYCEQQPPTLSNFGMGVKVLNYYRRKDVNDDTQPDKAVLGEPSMLQPEDRSPFSIFGTVDPGETVPTLSNQMYRAPIFRHNPRSTDFILGRSHTGVHGTQWYLRKIDHLYVVGQTFPSVEVPGPQSRKVTNVSRNRMKMIAHRMIRHREDHAFETTAMTPHIQESTDSQNRQKLKEFLVYKKEDKVWTLRPTDQMLDEAAIRSLIKPEDICLVESMLLGKKNAELAGYDAGQDLLADEDKDDDPLANKMVPWKTSKAFIDACAGKAMVRLHGEGDPTGHGLGFSFIKTSMKGGYIGSVQGPLATSADAIERERKANGGHSYNVKKQEAMYNAAISKIWGLQRETLADATEHDDNDVQQTADEDERFNNTNADAHGDERAQQTPAPHQVGQTPRFDDGVSQISRMTGGSRSGKRALRIVREVRNAAGELETIVEVVEDPVVVQMYIKRRREEDAHKTNIYELEASGNKMVDQQRLERVDNELMRLLKCQDRRLAREQQKAAKLAKDGAARAPKDASSPSASVAGSKVAGMTSRKCANCGQVGHIKTNKKLCPLFNNPGGAGGADGDQSGFGVYNAPAAE